MPLTKLIAVSPRSSDDDEDKDETKLWMTITIMLIYFLFNVAENRESEAACKLEKKEKTFRFMQ